MKSATNKMILTIVATILLPLVVYLVYAVSTLRKEEKVIEKVFTDQLDAIIFSVNQYSNDVLGGLLNKLTSQIKQTPVIPSDIPFLQYSNFHTIILTDTGRSTEQIISIQNTPVIDWRSIQDTLWTNHQPLLRELIKYKKQGYQKIHPTAFFHLQDQPFQVIHSILDGPNSSNLVFTGILDANGFSENVLGPKLQQIAGKDLILTLGEKRNKNFTYVTDSLSKEVLFKKPMWIIPDLEIGISSRHKTLRELVDNRTQTNMWASVLLIILLLFGFTLVVRNLRKEIRLAQNKSDFVANVSHELRTPLSLISMFSETLMLDRVPTPEKRKEYEQIIFKETNRLTNIVSKILSFSQMEANKRIYHKIDLDLNALISELLNDYSFHLEQKGFSYKFLARNIPKIPLDHDAIYEAMVNLLDNAMKYSSKDKSIVLKSGQKANQVFVEITDQGIGIRQEQITQIFDKFYRITKDNIHSTKGAGLGLSLVKHIMMAHNGKIEVQSIPGKGSTFRLVFYLRNHD